MAVAPRSMAVAVLACRTAAALLSAAAFACAVRAPPVYFTTYLFLEAALAAQLVWAPARLLYDAAQVWLQAPLPSARAVFAVLVAAEWAMTILLFAAGCSNMAVVVFLEVDIGACAALRPGACSHWRRAAAALTLGAWLFSLAAAILVSWLRASAHRRD